MTDLDKFLNVLTAIVLRILAEEAAERRGAA
jgi:hypothetical protein